MSGSDKTVLLCHIPFLQVEVNAWKTPVKFREHKRKEINTVFKGQPQGDFPHRIILHI